MKRYLVALTKAEVDYLLSALRWHIESTEISNLMQGQTRSMSERLTRKLDVAPCVTDKQVDRLLYAANNLLDDPEIVRDHKLLGAFAARSALWKVMG